MFETLEILIRNARRHRSLHLAAVNLRFLIGFAFIPAGLKKVLGQPFTDPGNSGLFHDFLHAFHATGLFYQFVGGIQLIAAVLLLTQRFAVLGEMLILPVLTAILVFCWSTQVYPTASVVTLMFLGILGLLLWDLRKWRSVLGPEQEETTVRLAEEAAPINLSLWRGCGSVIIAVYAGACIWVGGVYRPRGIEFDNPAFYVLPTIALLPVVTWLIERRLWRTE